MYCVKPAKQLINVHDLTDELKIYHYDIMLEYGNPKGLTSLRSS